MTLDANTFSDITFSTLMQLNDSPIEFFLTGSRYLDNSTYESDWDFFTTHTEETETFLKGMRFKKLNTTCYDDSNTVCVYNYKNIDIQLEKDVEKKKIAQKTIKENDLLRGSKGDRKHIWNIVYACIDALQDKKEG
jgi:hypothetical protein